MSVQTIGEHIICFNKLLINRPVLKGFTRPLLCVGGVLGFSDGYLDNIVIANHQLSSHFGK